MSGQHTLPDGLVDSKIGNTITELTVVLGSRWGDEGKRRLIDILSAKMEVCVRCAGGNNAGHTIVLPVGLEKVTTTWYVSTSPLMLAKP